MGGDAEGRPWWRVGTACLGMGLGLGGAAAAESEPGTPPTVQDRALIDRGYDVVGQGMVQFIDGIDRFFGDQDYDGLRNESYVRLGPGLRIRQGPKTSFKPRVRANLQLPRTERRLAIVLSGNDQNANVLDDGTGRDNDFGAELRAALIDDPLNQVDIAVGSHFRPEPDPFVKLQFEWLKPFASFALRPVLTGYWELDEGFGERTRLDIDYRLSQASLLRLRGDATYGQSTSGVEFRSTLAYYLKSREQSAWQVELRIDSQTRPHTEVVQYRGFVRYRWSMFRSWLFFEIEPGIRFRREDDFDPSPELTLRFEVVLMGTPAPAAAAGADEARPLQ